jgi:peptidoglycan hydrolase-like protein with peptidoglycan-binding domain
MFTTKQCPRGGGSGTTIEGKIKNLLVNGNIELAQQLMQQYSIPKNRFVDFFKNQTTDNTQAHTSKNAPVFTTFNRNLFLSSKGEDVRNLQKFLNNNGYTISSTGLGSFGNETNFFGQLTKQAVVRFQLAKNIKPAVGYFGPITKSAVLSMLK